MRLGNILVRAATEWKRLAPNTTTTRKYLSQIGDGTNSSVPSWQTITADTVLPTTTKGDLIVHDGSENERLPVGSNGHVLVADSGETLGVTWAAPSGGGAPTGASYVTLGTDATLSAERVLTAGDNLTLADAGAGNTVTLALDVHYASPEFNAGNSGTSKTINWNDGNTQLVTGTGNCTFTLTNPKSGGRYLLIIDNAGAYTYTFPSSVKWHGGTPPDLSGAGIHIVTLARSAAGGGIYIGNANTDFS